MTSSQTVTSHSTTGGDSGHITLSDWRPLGQTGMSVSPLGLGGAYLGAKRNRDGLVIDEELGMATVLRALELGINLIDTSGSYMGNGRSEGLIGKALSAWRAAGGRREGLVLSTKTGTRYPSSREKAYSASATWQSIEISLKLLNTEYLDIALVHDPTDLDQVLAHGGAWEALKQMKAQGIVKAIGLGVREHSLHQRLIATGECDVCLTYLDYHLLRQTAARDVLVPAAARGVAVLNGTTLYHGLLSGVNPHRVAEGWSGTHALSLHDDIARAYQLWTWCQTHDIDLLALNLQFCLRDTRVSAVLMGASTPDQITRDVEAVRTSLPNGVWRELWRQHWMRTSDQQKREAM